VAGARLTSLPIDKEHVAPELLRQRVSAVSPRFVYLTPTGQNPTGFVMPDSARAEIAKHSLEHGVTIVEDEVLADFSFHVRRPRPIAGFVPNANVLTIGSISKLFWPSLRVGWIRGPQPLIGRLARLKTVYDLGSALLPQNIATDLLDYVAEARELRRREMMTKRDLVSRILKARLPDAEFVLPKAGLCIWLRLPGVDSQLLMQAALRHSLVLSPGTIFSVDESHSEHVRIPFVLDEELLERGVHSLVDAANDIPIKRRAVVSVALALT
jgi:DNA-binding transcriptional MocR family regulator